MTTATSWPGHRLRTVPSWWPVGSGALRRDDAAFEVDEEDGLRKVGMSKERRADPQVQVGLPVDPSGFPLEVHLFEGN